VEFRRVPLPFRHPVHAHVDGTGQDEVRDLVPRLEVHQFDIDLEFQLVETSLLTQHFLASAFTL